MDVLNMYILDKGVLYISLLDMDIFDKDILHMNILDKDKLEMVILYMSVSDTIYILDMNISNMDKEILYMNILDMDILDMAILDIVVLNMYLHIRLELIVHGNIGHEHIRHGHIGHGHMGHWHIGLRHIGHGNLRNTPGKNRLSLQNFLDYPCFLKLKNIMRHMTYPGLLQLYSSPNITESICLPSYLLPSSAVHPSPSTPVPQLPSADYFTLLFLIPSKRLS